jgi:hypothetical protein
MATLPFPTPGNFPDRKVIYFNGEIAISIGTYKNDDHKSIGVRWTESESPIGYPSTRGHGMWLVLPDKLALYILDGIHDDIDKERKFIRSMDRFTDALIYIRNLNR